MHNALAMDVLDSSNDLAHQPHSLEFIQAGMCYNVIKQLAAGVIVVDDVNTGVGLEDLAKVQ